MSYIVCRIEKYKKSTLSFIQRHNQREAKEHKNKDINTDLTGNNYDLVNEGKINYTKAFESKTNDLNSKKNIRKDAVAIIEMLITSDYEFFSNKTPDETKQFFQDSLEFVKERYGANNVISANVHMDERTPHMHIDLVPITKDNRLNANEIFNRAELRNLQTAIQQQVGDKYSLKRGEPSDKKHVELMDFKKQTIKRLDVEERDLKTNLRVLQTQVNNTDYLFKKREKELQGLDKKISSISEDIRSKEQHLSAINKTIEEKQSYLKDIEVSTRPLVDFTVKQHLHKKLLGKGYNATERDIEKINQSFEDLTTFRKQYEPKQKELEKRNQDLFKSNERLVIEKVQLDGNFRAKNAQVNQLVSIIDEVVKTHPEASKIVERHTSIIQDKKKHSFDLER